MIVIADAGPLLHLHWIGASSWALPPRPIDVVDAVWDEVDKHAAEALQDVRLHRVSSSPPVSPLLTDWRLDQGEQAALSYALTCAEDVLILCDERQARLACSALSLPVVGSIGLIVEARRSSRVDLGSARVALRELPRSGRLHVDLRLIDQVLEDLE